MTISKALAAVEAIPERTAILEAVEEAELAETSSKSESNCDHSAVEGVFQKEG